ncbi:MAG: DinB family protein [candidate division Zixibacteria bacterium]|nr:DinB family protein [candidate division Zixibacteria bacterium]
MSEIERILDQLHRSMYGEAWHGPAVMELLAEIDAKAAAAKPIERAHSIWELALHIAAWQGAVRTRIGGKAVELSDEQDWPPVTDTSKAAWELAVRGLRGSYEQLRDAIAGLDDQALLMPVPGRQHNLYFLIHGVIQHNLYHAGQIAVLKKAL